MKKKKMAIYNKSDLYFFKFPEKFFESDEIEEIENGEDGDGTIILYLKLILLAVNKMGYLAKIIKGELIPYSPSELCKKTKNSEDELERRMLRLKNVGLIEMKDNILFIEEALKYTNQTVGAFKKSLQRKDDEEICPPNCPPDLDTKNKNLETRNQNLDIRNQNYNNSYSFEQQQEINITHPAWQDIICRVVYYLDKKTDRHFKPESKKATNNLKYWLSKGYEEDAFINVIDKMVDCWIGTNAEEYLRPETIFGPNFEDYLNGDWTRVETDWKPKYLEEE